MTTTSTPTITIDKSLLMLVTWTRAYEAALADGTPVRQHLSAAMRSAWADWRECVADGEIRMTLSREYDDRYGRMDRAMMRRRIAAAAKTNAMVPQVAQQQQAQAADPAPAPIDHTTIERIRALLIGRTAKIDLPMGEVTYRITGVRRWSSPDGAQVRDYIDVEDEGMSRDDRKGPKGIHIVRAGTSRGERHDSPVGQVRYSYGVFCNSGAKQAAADHLIEDLFAVAKPEPVPAPAMVQQQSQEQQACSALVATQFAAFDPADFDPEGGRPDLVCASADEARIILAGMDAEAAGQDRRAAEIAAAAATVHPPGVPDNRWLDEEVRAFIDGVLREIGDFDDGEPVLPRLLDEVIAEWGAYHATRRWADLFEKESEAPSSVPFGELFDARQAMQAAHARLDALTAKAAV